jgi:hypothetical protein
LQSWPCACGTWRDAAVGSQGLACLALPPPSRRSRAFSAPVCRNSSAARRAVSSRLSPACGTMPVQQGAEKAIRPAACRETLPDPGKGIAPLGGTRKRTAFPARARRFPADRQVQAQRQASARPGGREAPALGRGGRWPGALAPGAPRISRALWQGRWPLPGCVRRAQAEGFPALRSGSPCARHFFSTLLRAGSVAQQGLGAPSRRQTLIGRTAVTPDRAPCPLTEAGRAASGG